jgi:hypothetical protein
MTEHPSPSQPSDGGRLSREAVHAVLHAARQGIRAYPGPVGELIDRELRGYVDTGRQLALDALPERLVSLLVEAQEGQPAAGVAPARTLPARYRKGSPLHWDYVPSSANTAEADPG